MKRRYHAIFLAVSVFLLSAVSCTQEGDTEYIYRSTFTVMFDANGGSGAMESQDFEQGKEQPLTKNNFTAPSQSTKIFGGWATESDSNTVVYKDNQIVKITKNLTLYAVWSVKEGDGTATETKGWWKTSTTFDGYGFNNYRDTTVKPGNDFYTYSLGAWLKNPDAVGVWKTTEPGKTLKRRTRALWTIKELYAVS